ncbi:MAG: GTPase, partial [Pseudonocardiales bacterium]|nr:GTPase [Pseudonocardiales bacterium]
DVIAVNKADGEHADPSRRAARELSGALRLLRGAEGEWQPPVLTCSALHNTGLDEVWKHVQRHRQKLLADGGFEAKRRRQLVDWTRSMVRDRLLEQLETPAARTLVTAAEAAVLAGELTPAQAADRILAGLPGSAEPNLPGSAEPNLSGSAPGLPSGEGAERS